MLTPAAALGLRPFRAVLRWLKGEKLGLSPPMVSPTMLSTPLPHWQG